MTLYYFFSVEVQPSEGYVTTIGANAVFVCMPNCIDYNRRVWLVNGTLLETNLTNINAIFSCKTGTLLLQFTNIPLEYNTTNVTCRAELNSGGNITSNVAILLIQGKCIGACS